MKINYKEKRIQNENIVSHESYFAKFVLDLDDEKKKEIALGMVSGVKLKKLY
jgi:hypothetical protein